MNYLLEIKERKIKEVAEAQNRTPINELQSMPLYKRQTISLKKTFASSVTPGIICEFKRASPSKGVINAGANAANIVTGYAKAGAVGVSVLTDEVGFGGTLADLVVARYAVQNPILRKDFIVNPYQIIEAKAFGADVILLIAACLEKEEVSNFGEIAKELGLEVLLEVHDPSELEYLNEHVDILGVNNRNLKTFKVDLQMSRDIAKLVKPGIPKISESGITNVAEIVELAEIGFNGFLIGENFMKAEDPVSECLGFLNEVKSRFQ